MYPTAEWHVYNIYKEYLTNFLEKINKHIFEFVDQDVLTLSRLEKFWKFYQDHFLRFASRLLAFLDRFFTKQELCMSLLDVGVLLFFEIIFKNRCSRIVSMFMHVITLERRNPDIWARKSLLTCHQIIYTMSALSKDVNYYANNFESVFMQESYAYFRQISSETSQNAYSLIDYVVWADSVLKEEQTRMGQIYHEVLYNKYLKISHECLVLFKMDVLLDNREVIEKMIVDQSNGIE